MKNTVAIVTGASQGIGRSTALRLAQDFSSLVLAARNGDALKEVAKAVDQPDVQVLPHAYIWLYISTARSIHDFADFRLGDTSGNT